MFSLVVFNYYFNLKKISNIFIWLPIVYFAVLLRCLFGYEYISTILSSTFFYFVYLLLKYNYNYLKVILFSILLSSVLLSGFLSSFMFENLFTNLFLICKFIYVSCLLQNYNNIITNMLKPTNNYYDYRNRKKRIAETVRGILC